MATGRYDLIIVGGGVTGSALLYIMSAYTDISSVLLIEKYEDIGVLNTSPSSNSQTLHFGDVETNYTLEKSVEVKRQAERVLHYSKLLDTEERSGIIRRCQKMVLAVGDEEVESIDSIYSSGIRKVFPGLKRVGGDELRRIEPNTMRGRDPGQNVAALVSDSGYMVDFSRLSKSFVNRAVRNKSIKINVMFNTKAETINERGGDYSVITNRGVFKTRFVVFASGSYSLLFAKIMGCDKNISIISVGGDYYISRRMLKGKVYRVQKGGVPFAAVHADPDINNDSITRYGPTVNMPLGLEVREGTFIDYLKSFSYDIDTLDTMLRVVSNEDIRRILFTNAVYGLPFVGKYLFFENEVRKIIPSIKYEDLRYGKGMGGIRPQIVDERSKSFSIGASKLYKEGMIFNITPSPGASSALASAIDDMVYISKMLDLKVDRRRLESDLGEVSALDR